MVNESFTAHGHAMTHLSSPASIGHRPVPLLAMESVQRFFLWLMLASGFVVVIEPAPYEVLFAVSLMLFLAGGMQVSMVFGPMIAFLALYNIGGFLSVVHIMYDSKAKMFVYISVYMAITSIFFAMAGNLNSVAVRSIKRQKGMTVCSRLKVPISTLS